MSIIELEPVQLKTVWSVNTRKRDFNSGLLLSSADNQNLDEIEQTTALDDSDAMDDYPEGGFNAYMVVLGAFLGCVVNLGVINSIGAVQMWVSTHQLSHYLALTISWVFSIYLALAYALLIVAGPIFDKHGPKAIMSASTAALIFAGLMGVASSTKIWHFILSFIALGFGNGLGMSPSVGIISHWFMEKRGLMTGVATLGGSVGGLVFPLLLRYTYARYDFVWALRIFAFTTGGCMVLATIFVKERFRRVKPTHTPEEQTRLLEKRNIKRMLGSYAHLDRAFWVLVLGAFFAELLLVLIVTYFATYSVAKGATESTALLLLTVWNATGIPGRWVPGYFSDMFGRFNMNVAMLLVYSLLIWVICLPFGQHVGALYAFALVGGFFSGSVLSLLPACLAQTTPIREIGQRYGVLNAVLSLANLFGVPIASAIISKGSSQDYDHFLIFVASLATAGTAFWYLDRCLIAGISIKVKV